MASVRDLAQFGFGVLFGFDGLTPPATFDVPAGQTVQSASVGENRSQKWQQDAWRLWKWVGPLHYPSTRLSRQASQLEWRVRVNGRELTPQSAKDTIELATAGLGPAEATYLLSLNDFVAGEAWYIQEKEGRFRVYSVVEKDLEKKIKAARSAGRMAIRMLQRDPTDSDKADSSVRTAIGPAEEFLTLEALSQAQSRSRISQAGVIITPAEQLYAAEDPWEKNLLEGMTAAIKDVRSPSAMAPLHIRMRRDLIEFVRYITFPRPYDDLIDRKQERAVISIANALDIEPELIKGLGEATFWNAWAVSMETYQAHIAPRADRIGNLYADVIQRLRDDEAVVEVTPDPRVMLARRSTVRDAMDGYKLGVVNGDYVRDAMGATAQDKPSDEEREQMAAFNSSTMDRERRVGENPGPARSSPENASVMSDFEVALYARKELGMKLQEAWRHTPHRNRLSGLLHSDYTCHIAMDDIAREMPIAEVIADAVKKKALPDEVDRLTSWVMDTLLTPTSGLRAREEVNV